MAENIPSRYRKKKQSPVQPKLQIQTQLLSPQLTDYDSDEPGFSAGSAGSQSWSVVSPMALRSKGNTPASPSSPVPPAPPPPLIPISVQLPTQTIYKYIPQSTCVSQLLANLISEHRYELTADPEDFMLWENFSNDANSISIKRPLRSSEYIKHVAHSWGIEGGRSAHNITPNCINIVVSPSSLKLDSSSTASLTPRRDLIKECPKFSTTLYWCTGGIDSKKSSWKKCQMQIKNGSLSIHTSSTDRTLTIDEYDLYEGFPLKESTSQLVISLRSQLSPQYFSNPSDSLHHFTTNNKEDFNLLRNIIFSLRNQAIERVSRKYANDIEESSSVGAGNQRQQLINECHSPPNSSTSTFSSSSSVVGRVASGGSPAGRVLSGGSPPLATSRVSSGSSTYQSQSPFSPDSLLANQYKVKRKNSSVTSPTIRQPLQLRSENQKGYGLLSNIPNNMSTYQSKYDQRNQLLPNHSMALLHKLK